MHAIGSSSACGKELGRVTLLAFDMSLKAFLMKLAGEMKRDERFVDVVVGLFSEVEITEEEHLQGAELKDLRFANTPTGGKIGFIAEALKRAAAGKVLAEPVAILVRHAVFVECFGEVRLRIVGWRMGR